MSKNIKSKLESIFAIDTYETSDENRHSPDVMHAHNTLTGKKISIFKDEPIEEGEEDPMSRIGLDQMIYILMI